MFCPHCGTETPQGLNFCNRCGGGLTAMTASPSVETRPAISTGTAWAVGVTSRNANATSGFDGIVFSRAVPIGIRHWWPSKRCAGLAVRPARDGPLLFAAGQCRGRRLLGSGRVARRCSGMSENDSQPGDGRPRRSQRRLP